jgi:UDP-2-acetamido-3-amino-2,3-dideoxy-glucuronate N-acetyltransferase
VVEGGHGACGLPGGTLTNKTEGSGAFYVHPLADCQTKSVGENTEIWQFTVILRGASIGNNCNINSHCFIENDVKIGDNVTVKCGVYIWDGLIIEDNVFVGPNVTFTNDKYPRSKAHPAPFLKTVVRRNASIGAGAVLLPGIEVGANAVVGAGAVVTKDVPPNSVVVGSPARVVESISSSARRRLFDPVGEGPPDIAGGR